METYHILSETLQKIRRAEERLMVLLDNKASLEQKVRDKKVIFEKENGDVDKLEGLSIVGFFHLLKGTLIDKLDKEEREAMIAKNQYDFACQELEICLKEIKISRERIEDKAEIERKYLDILKEQEQALLKESTEHALVITRLTEEMYYQSEIIREIREAIEAGQILLDSFRCIYKSLKEASTLGIVDILESGLLVSDCSNHTVKTTNEKLVLIQQNIRKYKIELSDVFDVCDINLEARALNDFSDKFLAGVIRSIDKIDFATGLIGEMITYIEDSLQTLEQKRQFVTEVLNQLKENKREIIETFIIALEK